MGKCLITKLQQRVNANNIPKLGYFPIRVKVKDSAKAGDIVITPAYGYSGIIAYLPNDGSYFTDENGNENKGTELNADNTNLFNHVYFAKNTSIIFINKYKLNLFEAFYDSIEYEPIDLKEFLYTDIVKISGCFYGSLNSFSVEGIKKLKEIELLDADEMDTININMFEGSSLNSLILHNADCVGDISKLPKTLFTFGNYFPIKDNVFQYSGTRPSDSKAVSLYGNINLGKNTDAFLIDNAKFISNSTLSDYKWKVIEIKGIRTAASDAAVQALNDFGLKVSVVP